MSVENELMHKAKISESVCCDMTRHKTERVQRSPILLYDDVFTRNISIFKYDNSFKFKTKIDLVYVVFEYVPIFLKQMKTNLHCLINFNNINIKYLGNKHHIMFNLLIEHSSRSFGNML